MKPIFRGCLLLAATALTATILSGCSKEMSVSSPAGNNSIRFELDDEGRLSYSVISGGQNIFERCPAGVVTSAGDFSSGLTLSSLSEERVIDETYTLPTGKTSSYINRANERAFTLRDAEGHTLILTARAYDDGVAFRYIVEATSAKEATPLNSVEAGAAATAGSAAEAAEAITVTAETTRFDIPAESRVWAMNWTKENEADYPQRTVADIKGQAVAYPALFKVDSLWVLLAEASVYGQPATHLYREASGKGFEVRFAPENPQFTVEGRYESPWRTIVLGQNLATIVETTIIENLNPPSRIDDMSWIKPGVAVFPWWGDYLANSHIETLKRYVDLAAEMQWEWIEFDVSLVGTPFRTSKEWETTAWLPEFTAYVRKKGIRVYGWDEIAVLNQQGGMEHVYDRYKELGIEGIKIDYIDSESQMAMDFRERALKTAADRQMLVSFHGELTPRGQRRTYPNMMTAEGVQGAEVYTFRGGTVPNPRYNCILPFTRNVTGPMDYTPATFTVREENPRVTTYAHELALPFVYESGWVCMADRPEMYLDSPAKAILQRVEATWDEIRFIDGYPGEFFCVARRKGESWYIAAINGPEARTIEIALDFLPAGYYTFDLYEDPETDALDSVALRSLTRCSCETFIVDMQPGGGFCTVIDPNR